MHPDALLSQWEGEFPSFQVPKHRITFESRDGSDRKVELIKLPLFTSLAKYGFSIQEQ
jgi:hypothetical protein